MSDGGQRMYRAGDEPVAGYRLQQFLGRGGFGEVWRAVGPGGIGVALKIIHDLDRKRGGKELRALRLLRDIRHPNLVPLLAFWLKTDEGEFVSPDFGPSDQAVAMSPASARQDGKLPRETANADAAAPQELLVAMGLAEMSLFDRLRECRDAGLRGIPAEELLTYLADAARAIDLLNGQHDIQHCDIKPQNILLLGGAAQVCDFGLAKSIGEVRETSLGAGTIAYGAPEVLLGRGPTDNTDQYSLAISYFELRTGELPFGSERVSDVLMAKQGGPIDLVLLPRGERQVIARATALDPTQRFASCQEMVRALSAALDGGNAGPHRGKLAVEAMKSGPAAVQRTEGAIHPRRWTWSWAAGSSVAAVGIAGLVWVGFGGESAGRGFDPSRTSAPRSSDPAGSNRSSHHQTAGDDRSPAWSREQQLADDKLAQAEERLARADEELAEANRKLAQAEDELAEADKLWGGAQAAPAEVLLGPGAVMSSPAVER